MTTTTTVHLEIAAAPVSWGVDYAEDPANPAWQDVLDEIASAGYRRTELGPLGYLPPDATRLREELEKRALAATATFVFKDFRDPARRAQLLDYAAQAVRLVAAVGGRHLVLIDHLADERAAVAGDGAGRRLGTGEFERQVDALRRVAEIAGSAGVVPVLHPHAGTFVEYEDEVERILAAVPPDELALCLDTGHCVYAEVDPVAAVRRYGDRLAYLHLKDVDPVVLREAIVRSLTFDEAVGAGVFCPLGEGAVDLVALRDALSAVGFHGPATVEQDRDPRACVQALDDARRSREVLAAAGLVDLAIG